MKNSLTLLAALMAVSFPPLATAQEPSFFSFQDWPQKLMGLPGEVKTFQFLLTLTSSGLTGAGGIGGWRVTLESSGGTLKAIDLEGLHVSTLFDHDGDDTTPLVPTRVDLADAASATAELIEGPPQRVSSTVVLHNSSDMFVAEGTYAIARIKIDSSVPAAGCGRLFVKFADSDQPDASALFTLGGTVSTPVFGCLADVKPEDTSFTLSVVPVGAEPPPEGDFVLERTVPPGDFLLEAEVLLTSTYPMPGGVDGPSSWALSVLHDDPCMQIERLTLEGVRVTTIFDHDGDPETPDLDPHPLDLMDASFKMLQRGSGFGSGVGLPADARGLVSAVVLNPTQRMSLHMNATDPILRVVYRIPVPRDGTTECRVDFVDGLKGDGTPVHNAIAWMGVSSCPGFESRGLVVRLTGREPPFRRGDGNSDGELDLSDAAFLLENLFLGGPRPSCRKTGDLDDNGSVEITDPIYLLGFLFLGGPPPRDARLCRPDPTPDSLSCLSYPCE